jgi:uncharacterized protein (TIGR02996 family)
LASVLAIIGKQAFERAAPKAKIGAVLALDHYASVHKTLEVLRGGGSLFLVTVRPTDTLWRVAILEEPFFEDGAWRGQLNASPIADVTSVIDRLAFESGNGLAAQGGRLANALQTPRILTDNDEALLRSGAGRRAPVTEVTEEQLIEQIADAPDDEAAHVVLMDWLLERGDPRGQAMREGTNGERWLGDLARVTTSRVWRRGLLESFELVRDDVPGDVWDRAADSPWLRTVRRIEKGRAKPVRYRAFVTSEAAQSLEDVTVPNQTFFDRLVERPRRSLRRLVLERPSSSLRDRFVESMDALPRLSQLHLWPNDRELEDAVIDWRDVHRDGLEIVLRAPHPSEVNRREAVTWLRAARPTATAEIFVKWQRASSVYRARKQANGLYELEVTTDDFGVDEVLLVQAMMPLDRLVIAPHDLGEPERHIEQLLDNANSWWLGKEVRKMFSKIAPERVELRGEYARLRVLFSSASGG